MPYPQASATDTAPNGPGMGPGGVGGNVRRTVHRHLGKVVAGTAIAVAGTAVMVAVTLPGTAGADESGGTGKAAGSTQQQAADGQGAAPGVVQQAPPRARRARAATRSPTTRPSASSSSR